MDKRRGLNSLYPASELETTQQSESSVNHFIFFYQLIIDPALEVKGTVVVILSDPPFKEGNA